MAKTLVGIVSSDKSDKTIVVTTRERKTHPLYKKQYTVSKRFMAHDEKNEAQTGDRVMIEETRPISARKRFRLSKVIERPLIRAEQSVQAITKEEVEEKPAKEAKPAVVKTKTEPKEAKAPAKKESK
jgi:small subunit ribosomal protein S17